MKKMKEKKDSKKPKIKSQGKREKKFVESKVSVKPKYFVDELPKR